MIELLNYENLNKAGMNVETNSLLIQMTFLVFDCKIMH